jgi:magnesium chelatase family protein
MSPGRREAILSPEKFTHNGVLFLDEMPEFKRSVLEVMQPLEDREVNISRARFTVNYPASFMLVASMNPSPSLFP